MATMSLRRGMPAQTIPPTARQFTAPAIVAQQKFLDLVNADKTDTIRIDPQFEEQQAFEYLMRHLPHTYTERDYDLLMKAYVVASYAHRDQNRQSGEPYILHPIAVTTILAETMHMDVNTLVAGMLHDVAEDTEFGIDYIRQHFNEDTANLVDGVTKLKRINQLSNAQGAMANAKAESLRKMFLAMVEDIRVVIIKLADRLHNMRTLGGQPKTQAQTHRTRNPRHLCPVGQSPRHLADQSGSWRI